MIPMKKILPQPLVYILCALTWICLPKTSQAAAVMITTNVEAGGNSWTNPAIWKTNGVGTSVFPIAGLDYQCIQSNNVPFGNNVNNTRIRNPATAGLQTFPGNSLTLFTNTEIRAKQAGAILNFPDVGGNPGLIFNGGVLNAGDDTIFEIRGKIQVAANSYGILC